MYLSFYRLHDAPFNITPDPAFMYWTPRHQEAFAALTYGVDAQKGFIAVVGEVGCGKTTVLRSYLEQADPDRIKTVYLINPEQSFENVLRTMMSELGIVPADHGTDHAVEALHRYLLECHKADQRVVLIVDEAQRMPPETIERLRILSNLETDKAKLLQIVLCGQPELDTLLGRDELRQIRERIAVRAYIGPLSPAEARACIGHRVECAGGRAEQIFTRGALKEIVCHTKGNPRLLNVLCDNTLIAGFAERKRPVSNRVVRDAFESIGKRAEGRSWKGLVVAAASLCLVAALAFGVMANSKGWELSATSVGAAPVGSVITEPSEPVAYPSENRQVSVTGGGPIAEPGVPETVLVKRHEETVVSSNPLVVPEAEDESVQAPAAEGVQEESTESLPSVIDIVATEEPPGLSGNSITVAMAPESTQDPAMAVKVAPKPVPVNQSDNEGAEETKAIQELTEQSDAVVGDFVEAAATSVQESTPPTAEPPETIAEVQEAAVVRPLASGRVEPLPGEKQVWVTVVYGDSMEGLIKRLNGTIYPSLVRRTLALNPGIEDADRIYPGDRVAIPVVPEANDESSKEKEITLSGNG